MAKLHPNILLMTLFCLFLINKSNAQNYNIIEPSAEHYSSKASLTENRTTQTSPIKNASTNNSGQLNKAFNLSGKSNVVAAQSTAVNCYIPPDGTYTNFAGNDDGSIGPIALPFAFSLYGINYTSVYINNNGNLTFTGPYGAFDAVGFPFNVPMVAPFWADVDTRVGNTVKFKVNPTNLIVTWPGVGYYNQQINLLNTFQVIISNGNDPLIGLGNNVAFYYGEMQWTTGGAITSGGVGGFGGIPATVGINKGNSIDYIQIGRFNQNNTNYGGPLSGTSGVNYLDFGCYLLTAGSLTNLQPSVSGIPTNNTLNIACGETGTINLTALPPEVGQSVSVAINTGGLCNTTQTATNGTSSNATVTIAGSACNEGTHNISFVFTDNFNPSASTTVNIIVVIGTAPVISCPSDITVSNTSGQCGANVSFAATATGSLAPTLTYAPASGSFFPVGTTTVTATATNACGSDTCTFTVTVNPDNLILPIFSPVAAACNGQTIGTLPTSSTNGITGTWSPALNNTATTTYTFTPDANQCASTASMTIGVNPLPNVTISGNTTICQGSSTELTVNVPTAAASPGLLPPGNNGTSASCDCPPDYVVVGIQGTHGAWIDQFRLVCQKLNTNGTLSGPLTYTCYSGVNPGPVLFEYLLPANNIMVGGNADYITWGSNNFIHGFQGYGQTISHINNAQNNASSPTTTTSVVGWYAPSGNLGNSFVPNGSVVTGMTASSNFYSSGVKWNYKPIGQFLNTYSWSTAATTPSITVSTAGPVSVTATDYNGCSSTASTTVIVNPLPTITCPANIVVSNTPNQCGAIVNFVVTATGTPTPTLSYSHASGSFFPVGTTTVTVTATNTCGAPTCTFTVTVNDTQPPSISCPANITVSNTTNQCGANVTFTATATDNCGTANLSYSPASGSTFPVGTTTVTATANDGNGNSSACTFTVTVNDTQAPTIACAPAVVISNSPGLCTGTTTLALPTVSDNCPTIGNALSLDGSNDRVVLPEFNLGTSNFTIETWIKPNSNTNGYIISNRTFEPNQPGNWFVLSRQASGIIAFEMAADNSPPYFAMTNNTAVPIGVWSHIAVVRSGTTVTIYINGVADKTQSDTVVRNISTGNYSLFGGFPAFNAAWYNGALNETRIWTVARTASQIQLNRDTELSAQAGLRALYHYNQGTAGGNNAGLTNVIDSSGNNLNGTLNSFALNGATSNWVAGNTLSNVVITNNAPTTYAFGANTVTWTATDAAGNTTTCNQTVTVNDTEAPTISCPSNITVNNTANQCGAIVTFAATASDNCGTATLTYSQASGSFFTVGTTSVTANANDGHGNTTSCTFTVTVNDTQPPVISCPANIDVDLSAGQCGAFVSFAATASDNCGTAYITYSHAPGSLFNVGTTTVTATANDGNGNTTSCTFTVRVDLLDHVNLQWPPNATICPGGSFTAYGQVYEPNVTTVSGSQGANIEVQFGYSSTNTNPSGWSNWTNASFNQFGGGNANDEYEYIFSLNTPGTYYYTFRYRQNGCDWQYGGFQQWDGGTWDGTNYVSGVLTVQSLDWANLQWPPSQTICQGSGFTAYGQVYEPGVTTIPGARGAGIDVQFGYNSTNTNPSGWSNWIPLNNSNFNALGGGPSNDEYFYNFTPPTSGTYYYTFRYRLNGCLWQYGGYTSGGGYFWDGTNSVSGRLNVDPTTVGGAVSGGTSICPGETSALLTLSGYTGAILGWEYSTAPFLSWDPIGNNNNTYTSGPLSETTKFRAIIQSGVCSSQTSGETTVIVYLTYPFYADNDDDGYGAGAVVYLCSDAANNPPDGYTVDGTDCDDTQADRHETFPFYVDADGDGYGAEGSTAIQLCAIDGNTPPEPNYSVNDDDCNDLVFAINPSVAEIPFDNIDNNCNGSLYDGHPLIVVNVLSPSCGGINHGLNNTLNCTEIYLGEGYVIGYRFKVTNLSTGQVDYVDTVQHHFKLTDTDIYAYGTSYSIQVAAIVNGEVQGYNGAVCTLTTTNVATTKVVNSQCGSTLLFMNSTINANAVNSAIKYRFRVARADAPNTYYYTDERNLPNFNLTMLTVPVGFLTYSTEYKVDVQIKIKLANIIAWSQFGQVCSIFTPIPPTSSVIASQCELIASSYTQVINATPFAGATVYRFLLTHYDGLGNIDYQQYQDSPTPSFTLSMFTGLQPNTLYSVAVSMQLYGTFVPYDKDCSITTPPSAKAEIEVPFNATVYPNPYNTNFMVNVKTTNIQAIDIKVYDMVGRLVEQRVVKVDDLENAPIGERYPSGVYNVVVSQGEEVKTLRIVKR